MSLKQNIWNKVYRLINIIVYRMGYFSFKFIYKAFFRMEVYGRENIPSKGACILASNHSSFLDPPIIGTSHSREMYYFARSSLMKHRSAKILFQLWNCIPVDRDNPSPGTLKQAIHTLKENKALLLFPEGTRSLDGKLQEGKMGIGFIAHKAKVPIIPVYIDGSYEILPKGSKRPRFTKLRVRIGKPLGFQDLYQKKGNDIVYQAISNGVMNVISALRDEVRAFKKIKAD